MKIYTRTGDFGETSLFGGARVPKDHARVEACGSIDELNAFIGAAVVSVQAEGTRSRLERIQHDLFSLGAHLATLPPAPGRKGPGLPPLPSPRLTEMEGWIDEAEARLEPLTQFILPGGSHGASALHVCRTVCRRAERSVVGVARDDQSASFVVRYLNRLSDLLFVLARTENRVAGREDTKWRQEVP